MTHRPEFENRCKLTIVGQPVTNNGAGFMVANDYHRNCTTLVRDVLAYHFMNMEQQGVLQTMFEDALETQAPACPAEGEDDPVKEAGQLGFDAMSGIVCMHVAGTIF